MTALRHVLVLVTSLAIAGLAGATATTPASARTIGDQCLQRDPIPIDLLAGAQGQGCSLVGRMVTDGWVSVMVPPAGTSMAGDGVARHGEVRGLTVINTGTTVRAIRGPVGATSLGRAAASRAGSPAACKDKTFHLEGHTWAKGLRYRINVKGISHRLNKKLAVKQIQIANGNMRKGRNTCHKARLKTPASHYLGRTKAKPNIKPNVKSLGGPGCGKGNTSNIVGFGNLPSSLLGWTCYWWGGNGRMLGADIMIDNGRDLVTKLPKTCTNKWDFEGTVTHEWGHAYGMAHTGSGHANLTMQHILSPCSTYARTLGLGDWRGMNKMYGHRH